MYLNENAGAIIKLKELIYTMVSNDNHAWYTLMKGVILHKENQYKTLAIQNIYKILQSII